MDKVDILYNLYKQNIPFSFIKLNDGECQAMDNHNAIISRGDDKSSDLMASKLKESLNFDYTNYFVGIPCKLCRTNEYNIAIKYLSSKVQINENKLLNANILINSNTWKTFDIISQFSLNRNIIIVSNETNLKNIKNLKKFNISPYKIIKVSEKNAFENDYFRIKDNYKDFKNNDVIICLCGPLGRILCYEWYKNNPTLTCLELGSLFDPFLKNRTYAYHTLNHPMCNECFPNFVFDKNIKDFVYELIENQNIENECFYCGGYEDKNFYLSMFGGNLDRLYCNTLIRLKKNNDDLCMKYLKTFILGERLKIILKENNINLYIGYPLQIEKQSIKLIELANNFNNILIIGLTYGFTSLLFLENTSKETIITTIDLGNSEYFDLIKNYFDCNYPNKHNLYKCDQFDLNYLQNISDKKYDLIFINASKNSDDILNYLFTCTNFITNDTIIILNDTINDKLISMHWNDGPTYVIDYLKHNNYITLLGSDDYEKGRGMSWFKFNNIDDLYLLPYKKLNKSELFKKIEELYFQKFNSFIINKLCNYYINLFRNIDDKELRLVYFYSAVTENDNNKKIILYENLLSNKNKEDYIDQWTKYNLQLLYYKDTSYIPKIIHLIYLKERKFFKYNLRCIMSIAYYCPDYKIILYNDIEPVNNFYWNELKKIKNLEIKPINRIKYYDGFPIRYVQYEADILRLELLYNHGGIYFDTDILLVQNFDELLKDNKGFYISREYGDTGGLINSFLASKKNNEFIKIWLDTLKSGLRMDIWAYHIRESNKLLIDNNPHFIIKYDIQVINGIHFFPIRWQETNKFDGSIDVKLSENTYGVHLFETILHNTLLSNKFLLNYYNYVPSKIIVSLTTIPARFKELYLTINSMLNQTLKPDQIIINIPDKYENYGIYDINHIENINSDIVIINKCNKDYGPATKYLGLLNLFDVIDNNDLIIIIDDDRIYENNLIEKFNHYKKIYPDYILTIAGWDIETISNNKFYYAPKKLPRGIEFEKDGFIDIFGGCCGIALNKYHIPIDEELLNIKSNDKKFYVDDVNISGYITKNNYYIYLIKGNDSNRTSNNIISSLYDFIDYKRLDCNNNCIEYFRNKYNIWKDLDLGFCKGYMALKYHMEEAYLENNYNLDLVNWDPPIAIFSKKYYNQINELNHNKIHDYCFIGSIKSCYERRKWIIEFANKYFTENSIFINTDNDPNWLLLGSFDHSNFNNGFNPKNQPNNQSKEVQFRIVKDNKYYFETMCQSKFVLCPAGDSSWSFRFYEVLMSKSIPIVESWHHTYRTIEESRIKYKYVLYNNIGTPIDYNNYVYENTLLFEKNHLLS